MIYVGVNYYKSIFFIIMIFYFMLLSLVMELRKFVIENNLVINVIGLILLVMKNNIIYC